jgi:hypothetical protein
LHCANPNCHTIAEDLLKGTLSLVEFETAPADRLLYAEGGFPCLFCTYALFLALCTMFGASCYQEVEFHRIDPRTAPGKQHLPVRIKCVKDTCIKSDAGNSESPGGSVRNCINSAVEDPYATPFNPPLNFSSIVTHGAIAMFTWR